MKSPFERYARKYDAWYERNCFAFLSELAALKKFMPRQGKGLEIGAGTGRFAAALGIGFGVEPSPAMRRLAQSRGITVKAGKGEHLPFAAFFFDYVAIINTLSFVEKPRAVIAEAARVLKHKGRIIIGMLDKNSFLGIYYRKKKGPFYDCAAFLDVAQVRGMLHAVGFRRISCRQAIFSLPEKITSVEKPRQGFGQGGFVVLKGELS